MPPGMNIVCERETKRKLEGEQFQKIAFQSQKEDDGMLQYCGRTMNFTLPLFKIEVQTRLT